MKLFFHSDWSDWEKSIIIKITISNLTYMNDFRQKKPRIYVERTFDTQLTLF